VANNVGIQLSHIHLKHFRCFDQFDLDFDGPLVLLEGANGIGKTSILEALHYACYLRSFRTRTTKELISFGKEGFFIKVAMHGESQLTHTIRVGFSHNKRLVKVDQQTVSSYKDLMTYYKVLSVTEDDLQIVQGGPQERRTLLDQFLLLTDQNYGHLVRIYRQLVDQRNALLYAPNSNMDTYAILTKQLWEKSKEVQELRQTVLVALQREVSLLRDAYLPQLPDITFSYRPKLNLCDSIEQFDLEHLDLYSKEKRYKRTLFGSHLDDVLISFHGQPSRLFASRGQQKLIVLLIKMAQLKLLSMQGHPGIFLLDDFMTDFDQDHASVLLEALQGLGTQLIFTSPSTGGFLADRIVSLGGYSSNLTY